MYCRLLDVNWRQPSQDNVLFSLSDFDSLRDQLKLMASPNLRSKYEYEVVEKAQAAGHKALKADVIKQSSDTAIANLYHYFQEA